jgi:4-amino-4-deoxy-L-arabinose transferase-like glycosyltransferase
MAGSGSSRTLFWAAALVGLTLLLRVPALVHPFAIDDERVYSVVAHEMLDGGKPYRDAKERKPPLLFWSFAGIHAVVGKYNWPGLHAAMVLWVLLTMAGVYRLVGARFGARAGLLAAGLYSIYQPWWSAGTLALNGELAMNLPLVWAAWLVLRPGGSRIRPELAGAGALLAAGFLLKQPAALAAPAFGLYLLLPAYRRSRGLTPVQALWQAALLSAGFGAAVLATALLLARQGILPEAIHWTLLQGAVPFVHWPRAVGVTLLFALIALPVVLGARQALRRSDPANPWSGLPAERQAALLWLAASGLGVALTGQFVPHYYIQLLPPLILLAAPILTPLLDRRRRLLAGVVGATAAGLLAWHTVELSRMAARPAELGAWLRANSTPDQRVFIWGQAAGEYLRARRRPASRYIQTDPLTGYVFGSPRSWDPGYDTSDRIDPEAWDTLAVEFARHPPAYIVDMDAGRAVPRYPISAFPYLRELVARKYRPAYRSPEGIIYRRVP